MILGIDASNIRSGGGITHLVEVLRSGKPGDHGFRKVIVWGGKATLGKIEEQHWLVKDHQAALDRNLAHRVRWQFSRLSKLAFNNACSALLVPGGSYSGRFRPVITISRNLLPFEENELARYGCSLMALKLLMLRRTQSRTFRRADGLIFLTEYAQKTVMEVIKKRQGRTTIVPHGINKRLFYPACKDNPKKEHSQTQPFRVLYVSIIDMYKHQCHVAAAVACLRRRGVPVTLDLAGPAYRPALKLLNKVLQQLDPAGEFLNYLGEVPHADLMAHYARADICLFASSCENLPNILIEGMASGLPICCSNRGPMPEVLGNAGVYFDPEDPHAIASALQTLIESPELRLKMARAAFERAQAYSWETCARDTFSFVSKIARRFADCKEKAIQC